MNARHFPVSVASAASVTSVASVALLVVFGLLIYSAFATSIFLGLVLQPLIQHRDGRAVVSRRKYAIDRLSPCLAG